jgi:hypothetical protein
MNKFIQEYRAGTHTQVTHGSHTVQLDVEGHEATVLDGIDFGRMRIDAIFLCESGCKRVLPRLGYVKTKRNN